MAQKVSILITACLVAAGIYYWRSRVPAKDPRGAKVLAFMSQVGRVVRECQEQTGRNEAYCKCLHKDDLDKINGELKGFIAQNPGMENLYLTVNTDATHTARYRIGDLVPRVSFDMYCRPQNSPGGK